MHKMYEVYEVYKVYKVYKVSRVYKVYRLGVLVTPGFLICVGPTCLDFGPEILDFGTRWGHIGTLKFSNFLIYNY